MYKILILFVVSIGLFLRLYKINVPLLEFYPSRQIQTAEIARNFYAENLNILRPTIHYFGPGDGIFPMEFPLYNYVVSLLYRIFGLNETLGRLLSVSGWLVSLIILYRVARNFMGIYASIASIFFFTISPLSVLLSRSFQPDQWMITTSLGSIYFLNKWYLKSRKKYVAIASVLSSISLLLKVPSAVFIFLPALFIFYKKKSVLSRDSIIFFSISLLPSLLWYIYATLISISGAATEGNFSISNWFGPELFINKNYYSNIFGFEYNLVLLPAGILLFFIGILISFKSKMQFLYIWLLGVLTYFVLFNKHNMTHEYYHMPLLPIASLFIGASIEKIASISAKKLNLGFVVILLLLVLIPLMIIPTINRAYSPIERFEHVTKVGSLIKNYTNSSDLIIGSMDAGPTLVYYSNRLGWTFSINKEKERALYSFYGEKNKQLKTNIEQLESYKLVGAKIFASSYKKQLLENKEFSNYLYDNYKVLEETDDYIIFALN